MSIPAGYPCWNVIVDELEKIANQNGSYSPIDRSDDLPKQIEQLRGQINDDDYREKIIQMLGTEGKEDFRPIHGVLMKIPFHSFITTNYDLCLEKAAEYNGEPVKNNWYPELDSSLLRARYVFHIHGLIDQFDVHKTFGSMIISEREYINAYENESNNILPNFLANLFQFHTVAFLGFSLMDNYIFRAIKRAQRELASRAEFEQTMNIGNRAELKHYIFSYHDVETSVLDRIKYLGLNPILYAGENFRHTDLQRILEEACRLTTGLEINPPTPNRVLFLG